jgi:flagellum-specific peptidoglycan hydrolase FlgJ
MPGFFVSEKDLREAQSMRFRGQSKSLIDTFTEQLKAPPASEPAPVQEDAPAAVPESAPLSSLEWDRGIDTGTPTESPTRSGGDFQTLPVTPAAPPSSRQNLGQPTPAPRTSGLPSFEELTRAWMPKATRDTESASPASFLPTLQDLAGKWMPQQQPGQPATPDAGATDAQPSLLQPLENVWKPRGRDQAQTQAQPGRAPGAAPTGELPPIDTSSAEAFIRTATPYAQRAEQVTGIPAALAMAVAANESGWGKHSLGNNFFGIQAQDGEPGNPYTDYRPDGTPYQARLKSFSDPADAFIGFGRFLLDNSRYQDAIEAYRKTGDPRDLATGMSAAGYNEARLAGPWSGQVRALIDQITPQMASAPQAPQQEAPKTIQPQAVADGPGWQMRWGEGLTPNQIKESEALGLDWDTQIATCGIAGAIALSRATGGNVTFGDALDLAQQMGEWNKDVGMVNGFAGELRLLKRLGVEARAEDIDENKIAQTVASGTPVVVNATGNGGHYYVAQNFDASTGKFDFGNSASILKRSGGQRWFRLDELASLGVGTPANALYLGAA